MDASYNEFFTCSVQVLHELQCLISIRYSVATLPTLTFCAQTLVSVFFEIKFQCKTVLHLNF